MTDERANEITENTAIDQVAAAEESAPAEHTPIDESTDDGIVHSKDAPQYGVGPFSIREVAIGGVWLVAFVVSFFSVASQQAMAQLLFGGSVWANGLDWILTIGVPTVAVFLLVLRRFSPDGIRRVGSLGVDQFASVAFSVSAVVWLTLLWRNVGVALETGLWIYGWVVWVEFFLAVAGVVLTVFAPVIPMLSEDFTGRREVVAHRNARPVRAVSPRPAPAPRPVAVHDQGPDAGAQPAADVNPYATTEYDTNVYADAPASESWDSTGPLAPFAEQTAQVVAEPEVRPQAFWALAPEERDIVDEQDVPIFRIGPAAWALVLEDRGEVFVVRHEDGRVGYLHDVSGVTRG